MPIPNFSIRPSVSQIPKELAENFPTEYANLVKNEAHIYKTLPLRSEGLPGECVEDWYEKFGEMGSSVTNYLADDRSDTMRDLVLTISGYKNFTSASGLENNALIEACKYKNLFDLGGLQDTIAGWSDPTSLATNGLSSITSTIAGLQPSAYNVHEAAIFKNVQSQMTNEIINYAYAGVKVKEFDILEYLGLTKVLGMVGL